MSVALFTERFVKTGVLEEAQNAHAVDAVLLGAVHDALKACNLVELFLRADDSDVPRQLCETSPPAWSVAAAQVYIACGGGSMSTSDLFAYIERIAELRLEPFGAVFAAALAQAAENAGWSETVAALTNLSVGSVAIALAGWHDCQPRESVDLLKAALESELAFVDAPGADAIERTRDRTFVRQD